MSNGFPIPQNIGGRHRSRPFGEGAMDFLKKNAGELGYGATQAEAVFNPYADSNSFFEGGYAGINQRAGSAALQGVGTAVGQFSPAIGAGLQGLSSAVDLFAYNPKVESIGNQYNPYEYAPQFDLDDERQMTKDFRKNFRKDALSKVGSATAGGAAIGSMFSPLGTAIGAGVGALVGGVGALFARKKSKEAEEEANKQVDLALGRFNTATKSYYDYREGQDRYLEMRREAQFGIPMYNTIV